GRGRRTSVAAHLGRAGNPARRQQHGHRSPRWLGRGRRRAGSDARVVRFPSRPRDARGGRRPRLHRRRFGAMKGSVAPVIGRSTFTATAAPILAAGGTLAAAAWLYEMPPDLSSPWGLNHPGLEQFRALWHLPAASLAAPAFQAGFWLLIALAWAGYGALLLAGARGGRLPW